MHSELEDFLGGTYHQDIESPEDALKEFINDSTQISIKETINNCVNFLSSEWTIMRKRVLLNLILKFTFPQSD